MGIGLSRSWYPTLLIPDCTYARRKVSWYTRSRTSSSRLVTVPAGDTIRVSLTGGPAEVKAWLWSYNIFKLLGFEKRASFIRPTQQATDQN